MVTSKTFLFDVSVLKWEEKRNNSQTKYFIIIFCTLSMCYVQTDVHNMSLGQIWCNMIWVVSPLEIEFKTVTGNFFTKRENSSNLW